MRLLNSATSLVLLLLLTTITFAYSLSDYPALFITQGMPAPNLAIIVGDDAAASDVLGAVDVAISLQAATTGYAPDEDLTQAKQSMPVNTRRNLLAINDYLGNVREAFTELDSDLLKGGSIVTPVSATPYHQYLRFTNNSGLIKFDRNSKGKVDTYLSFTSGDQIFEWQIQFDKGLISQITGNELTDLHDKEIQMLGQPMVIVDTDYTESTGRVMLKLMGGAISPIMSEADKQTYRINGKPYYVEVIALSSTSNNGEGSVKFRINGEITEELNRGSISTLQDGTHVGVRSILPTGKDTQKSVVQFYLGAYYITFEDRKITDTQSTTAGATVNGNTVTTGLLKIDGKTIVTNKTVSIDSIKYSLLAEPLIGELDVPPNSGISAYLKTPEGMLLPNWDIYFNGLTKTKETIIKLNPVSEQKYELQFTNQEGIYYEAPILNAQNNCLRYGDDKNNLWFIESNSPTTHYGKTGDFFVLSKCNPTANKNTCNTHIIKYKNADTSSATTGTLKLTFTDLGTGEKELTLTQSGTDFTGTLSAGDGQYAIHANSITNSNGQVNISIDLNGDGAFTNGEAIIGTNGYALIDLGTTNTNESNQEGRDAIICTNPTITLRTLSKEFEKASGDEAIATIIEPRTANTIGISSISATTGYFSGLKTTKRNYQKALTGYGAILETYDSGNDRSEILTINYPLEQRGADVSIGKQQATIPVITEIDAQTEDITETAKETINMFKNTRITNIMKLASEIDNIRNYNSIIIGGACANPITAELQGNPSPCWESIAQGVSIIKAYDFSNGNLAIVVAGRNAADTRRATSALANNLLKDIKGPQARITKGTKNELFIVTV